MKNANADFQTAIVAVDIGNSSTKIAVEEFDEDHDSRWFSHTTFRGDDAIDIELDQAPVFWSVCSVNQTRFDQLDQWIKQHRPQDQLHAITEEEVEIQTAIQSRSNLGRDRLIAAWMALQLCEQGPIVVIDAGTAVTIDLVDPDGIYQGGVLFLGACSSLSYLPAAAPALPDLSDPGLVQELDFNSSDIVGKNTRAATLGGVYRSQIISISEIARQMGDSTSQPYAVYATGGGILAIEKYLPADWQFVPDLVLQGARNIGQRLLQNRLTNP